LFIEIINKSNKRINQSKNRKVSKNFVWYKE
jgi:hypothetical protein